MGSYFLLMCILCITSTQAQKDILPPPYTCTTTTTLCQPGETTEHAPSTLQTSSSQGRPGKRGMNGLPGLKGEKGEPCQCNIADEKAMRELKSKMDDIEIENREMKQQIRDLETRHDKMNQTINELDIDSFSPSSCGPNGTIEKIYPWRNEGNFRPVTVNCELYSVNEDGWITIQKRQDGSVRFYDKNWENYAIGFGDKNGEYWLGLRAIHQLTTSKSYKLRIDLRFQSGSVKYAEYSTFKVGSEKSKFQLTISGYSGNAADKMLYHNQQYFSTYDVDNDLHSGNCARQANGAWWYKSCYHSNLNGKYDGDLTWVNHLSFSEMKILPV